MRFLSYCLLLLTSCLVGCQTGDPGGPQSGMIANENIFGNIQARPQGSNPGYGDLTGSTRRSGSQTLVQSYRSDVSAGPTGLAVATPPTAADGGSYTLNFENADVKDVIRAVLHDALQVNYTITGNVAGPVTLSSTRPVGRNELLSTLEKTLDAVGVVMTRDGDSFRISSSGTAGTTVDKGFRARLGYGVSVVPLRYVKASTMMELISGFVAPGENLKIDAAQKSILIRGSGAERQAVVNAIQSFDEDWMENQSVSIFTLQQAKPETVLPELERIFDAGENGAIEFRSVDRLRGILAISRNPKLIARAASWVRRLDRENPGVGEGVFVYKPKHRNADDLAKVMSGLFGSGQGTSAARRGASPFPSGQQDGAPGDGNTAEPVATADGNTRVASAFETSNDVTSGFGSATAPGVVDLTTQQPDGGGGASGIRISADLTNNAVVTYADADAYRKVLTALQQLDSSPQQVAVNVTIAEVQLTDELKYGVQYFVNSHGFGFNNSNSEAISVRDIASSVVQSQIPGFNFLLGTNANPDVVISALSVISHVEILSSPSLVVVENQKATLQVGDEVPVTTRQSQSVENDLAPLINQVEFKNTGIILNVTPRIEQNDAVTMNVEQEISAVVGGGNTLTPTISKRRVSSQISVQNGQTVLLAGLISGQAGKQNSGVPGTRNVPILGNLLSQTGKSANRTELIMLIRPVVVRSSQDAATVAADLRARMSAMNVRQPVYKN